MTRTTILLTAVSLFTVASPLQGQWAIETRNGNKTAWAMGIHGQMRLDVSCQEDKPVIAVMLPGALDARNVNVEAQWDDGSIEHFTWRGNSEVLYRSAPSRSTTALVTKLRHKSTVRLHVQGARERSAMDLFDLTGSFRAIGSLSCETSVNMSSSRQSRRTATEIKDILIERSIAAYSGNCPCPFHRDKAGRRCGGRSAYSRPGGASPLCFRHDVGDAAVAAYRRSTPSPAR